MKNLLEKAQDYLDDGYTVPEELLSKMTTEDLETLSGLIAFKNEIARDLDKNISEKPFILKMGKKKSSRNFIVWTAAAVLVMSLGFPVYRTMENSRMIKTETREFVSEITGNNWTAEILSDDESISTDWFNAEPVVMEIY